MCCPQRDTVVNMMQHSNVDNDSYQIYSAEHPTEHRLNYDQTVTCKIRDKHHIRFKIDCGADYNILPLHVYRSATGDTTLQRVKPTVKRLFAYGQQQTPSVGTVILNLERRGISHYFPLSLCLDLRHQFPIDFSHWPKSFAFTNYLS